MEYRDRLPFPLFPALFPSLFALWYFDAGAYADDDPEVDDCDGGDSSPVAPDPLDEQTHRKPLSSRTQRTVTAFLKLLDTRPVQGFPNLLTDPWQLGGILDGLPAPPQLTYDDLDEIARLRDQLGVALLAGDALDAHELLNDLALEHGVTPQLTGDGEIMCTTAFREATATIGALFIPPLMELHASRWSDRVRECAEPRCWSYLLDLSKRGNQRYCSTACAARARKRRRRESLPLDFRGEG